MVQLISILFALILTVPSRAAAAAGTDLPADRTSLTPREISLLRDLEVSLYPAPRDAPDFALSDFDGRETRLSNLRGKVVLLTFWATWCAPCLEEVFSRSRLKRRLQGLPFEVVDVMVDPGGKGREGVQSAVAAFGLSFPVLLDPDGKVFQSLFKGKAIPSSYLIDPSGRMLGERLGRRTDWEQAEMVEAVASLSRRSSQIEIPLAVPMEKGRRTPSRQAPGRETQRLQSLLSEGWKLSEQGRQVDAVALWREALALSRQIGDRAGEGWALFFLAAARQSFWPQFLDEALKIAQETREERLEGLVLLEQGARQLESSYRYSDPDSLLRTKTLLERALTLVRREGYSREETRALRYLGRTYFGLGELQRAIPFYREALNRAEKGGFISEMVDTVSQFAEVIVRIGDYPRAIEIRRGLYEHWREEGDLKRAGHALGEIARLYSSLGNAQRAASLFEQSIALLSQAGAKKEASRYHGELGFEYARLRQWQKAEPYLKGADRVRRGTALIFQGKYKEAVTLLEKSQEPEQRDRDLRFGRSVALAVAHDLLVQRDLARKYYLEAVALVEAERESLSEEMRVYFFSGRPYIFERTVPYQGLIRVSSPDEAFAHAESLKARRLIEQSARRAAGSRPAVAPELQKEEETVNRQLALLLQQREAINKEIAERDAGMGPSGETLAERKKRAAELQARLRAIETEVPEARDRVSRMIARLYREAPEYASIRYPRTLQAKDVTLRPGEVLIEYSLTWGSLHAFLLRNGQVVHSLSHNISRQNVERMVETYRQQISDPAGLHLDEFNVEAGHRLYSLLLKELLPRVKAEETVIIVPDGKLAFLPFEALPMTSAKPAMERGEHGTFPVGVEWVGDRYRIRYAFSASALTQVRVFGGEPASSGLLAVADPIFGEEDGRLAKEKTTRAIGGRRSVLMRAMEEEGRIELPRLEETEKLGRNLQQLFASDQPEVLTGGLATKRNLLAKDLRQYRYVVFATHGLLGGQISGIQEPALALSWVDGEKREQFLTLSEVTGLRLNADVVALTACQTGLGDEVAGEGVMGMGRAFQYAGAKSVLVSLWSVAEESTTLLVERFFARLKSDADKVAALHRARNEVREAGYKHPFFWAPFILIGE